MKKRLEGLIATSKPFRLSFPNVLALFLLAGTILWYSQYQDEELEGNAGPEGGNPRHCEVETHGIPSSIARLAPVLPGAW